MDHLVKLSDVLLPLESRSGVPIQGISLVPDFVIPVLYYENLSKVFYPFCVSTKNDHDRKVVLILCRKFEDICTD